MRTALAIFTAILWGIMPFLPILAAPAHLRVVARRNADAGGGGTSPGTTGLVAWYDFADAADADGATYSLTENGPPTYNAGPPTIGTATDGAPGHYWSSTTLDDNFADADQDWSLAIRWKGHTSISTNDYIFSSNGGRAAIRWVTAGITGFLGHASGGKVGIAPALDTWYLVVLVHDAGGDTTTMSINGSTLTGGAVTSNYAAGTSYFGGSSATVTNNAVFDFAAFYGRELTDDEVDWLYNSGGTRTYSEL